MCFESETFCLKSQCTDVKIKLLSYIVTVNATGTTEITLY